MGHFAPDAQPTWESITLARFLRQLPPQIELIHDAGDRPLRWVEPSDMDNPVDYLMDEELILTSGFPLLENAGDQAHVDAFIARLAHAKVSALGFGLEPYFTTVPDTVLRACQRYGLNLLKIPASVPFAAIGIAFAKLMEADGAAALRANAEANRALMRCVAQPNAEEQLISTLAQRLKASVQLVNTSNRARFRAPATDLPELEPETRALLLREAAGPQPFALHQQDGTTHLAFPIRAAGSVSAQGLLLSVLLVGFTRTPSAFDHHLIATALGLLEVLARERATSSPASAQLALSLLLRSRTALDGPSLKLLRQSLGSETKKPVRVVAIRPVGAQRTSSSALHLAHLQSLLDTPLALEVDDYFVALTSAEPSAEVFERLKSAGYLAGFSTACALETALGEKLGELQIQAAGLLPQAMEKQQSIDASTLPRSFSSLLPAQAGKLLAEETLAPLLELPESRRDLYIDVLRGWLQANGSWDQASKNIDLHRNSVRRHIATISEILDMDLNLAEVRNELYFALTFLPAR